MNRDFVLRSSRRHTALGSVGGARDHRADLGDLPRHDPDHGDPGIRNPPAARPRPRAGGSDARAFGGDRGRGGRRPRPARRRPRLRRRAGPHGRGDHRRSGSARLNHRVRCARRVVRALSLADAREGGARRLRDRAEVEALGLAKGQKRRRDGADVRAEEESVEACLARLRRSLSKLALARELIEKRLAEHDPER